MGLEFTQGAYNPYDHDYIERTDDKLQEQLETLAKSREYAASGERREQIQREMGMIAFELAVRYRERKFSEMDQCWAEYKL